MTGLWSCFIGRAQRRLALGGVVLLATFVLLGTVASAAFAGNFFATGHDEDFHCTNGGDDGTPSPGECSYYQAVTTFVRGGSNLPLLILDRDNTSDGAAGSTGAADSPLEAVTALNLAYSNAASTTPTASSPPYVVEDPQGLQPTTINGTPPPGVSTSSTWATTPLVDSTGHPLWSAIIVASDTNCGGCDLNNTDGTHVDSDDINARASAIQTFFNGGGGLLYLAGATDAYDADGVSGKDVYYASVPVPVGGEPVSPPFTVTADGAALGITSAMANCCATHNSFDLPAAGSPLKVAETDSSGLAESLYIQGGAVCSSGFCTQSPPSVTPSPPSVGSVTATFSGTVVPDGLATTAYFQYGLDPKYSGGGPVVYTNSTPPQSVGSDFTSHAFSASVSGLVPNALYHFRLVATNAQGTVFGPDATFMTARGALPGPPKLGKSFNISLVSGLVLVKVHGVFIPLTEVTQIPANTQINAIHGTLSLVTAGGSHPAADVAAAKGKKGNGKKGKGKTTTQQGTFGGAIFKISQATGGPNKGLATLTIVENAFKGAPSYSLCTIHKAAEATAASSKRTLQLLHASAKGKFSTKGKYSAATVLGTKWTVADRCDGTLTHDITDSVKVTDFVHHKTVILHAGQSYLAKKKR